MNIKKEVLSTLKGLSCPVYYATNHDSEDDTYVIFYILNEKSNEFLDNEEASIKYKIHVQIISNTDYDDISDDIMAKMKANNFRRLYSAENFDSETNFYSKSIQFEYIHYTYL